MTDSIARLMTSDHQRCDHLLAACEQTASSGDWTGLEQQTTAFSNALLGRFDMEKHVLFPELVAVGPRASGPTGMATLEHEQMRALVQELDAAAASLGILETLHMIIRQHNAKEHGILYPMAEEGPGSQSREILNRLRAA
jgi:iron-sulfur cluster repair protein YtfE (RIC family)